MSTTGCDMETPETYTKIENVVERAINLSGGPSVVADEFGLSRQAVNKWTAQGFLPRTEWTGETDYAGALERMSGVSRDELLAAKPRRKGPRQTAGGRPRKTQTA
jgi:hypothetical protein